MTVLRLAIYSLGPPQKVKLVKIDAEGHELPVLKGMARLHQRDRPILIVETHSAEVIALLDAFGYESERLPASSNLLCQPR